MDETQKSTTFGIAREMTSESYGTISDEATLKLVDIDHRDVIGDETRTKISLKEDKAEGENDEEEEEEESDIPSPDTLRIRRSILRPMRSSRRLLQQQQEGQSSRERDAREAAVHSRALRSSVFDPDPTLQDWYGNIPLHHSCSRSPDMPDIDRMKELLIIYPDGARVRNQFGRLPLHYALDRCKASIEALKLLVDAYPGGVGEPADDGVTPYDLALKWDHPNSVLRLLLTADRSVDFSMYMRLTYGSLVSTIFSLVYPPKVSGGLRGETYSLSDRVNSRRRRSGGQLLRRNSSSSVEDLTLDNITDNVANDEFSV